MSDNKQNNSENKTSEVFDWRSAIQDYDQQKKQEKENVDRKENMRKLEEHREEQLRNNINKELRVQSSEKKKKERTVSGAAVVMSIVLIGLQTLRERLLTVIQEQSNLAMSLSNGNGIFNFHLPVKRDSKNEKFIVDEERFKNKKHIEQILKQSGITESPVDYFNTQILNKPIEAIKKEVEKNKPISPEDLLKSLPSKSMLAKKINDNKDSFKPVPKRNRMEK